MKGCIANRCDFLADKSVLFRLLLSCYVRHMARGAATSDKCQLSGLSRRSVVLCAEQRPKAAAHRRAALTARRFGCPKRSDQIPQGLGQHKVLQIQPWIAAPRPDAARLVETILRPKRPQPDTTCFLQVGLNRQLLRKPERSFTRFLRYGATGRQAAHKVTHVPFASFHRGAYGLRVGGTPAGQSH
ncbi:hypothetical protein LY39_02510 [Roseinatronobacter bogoriensis subsp. barguzinensis]|nr:hypothetical protein [Rhodobaca bogoriensis DSM 18756]TDW38155.1 hypothetical protein LY39_02510 [Rhodobaca barguzinensis]TDY69674.1 hypothetical protein EV660_10368 [Rhodobaca bogoriensis DSM 18756]